MYENRSWMDFWWHYRNFSFLVDCAREHISKMHTHQKSKMMRMRRDRVAESLLLCYHVNIPKSMYKMFVSYIYINLVSVSWSSCFPSSLFFSLFFFSVARSEWTYSHLMSVCLCRTEWNIVEMAFVFRCCNTMNWWIGELVKWSMYSVQLRTNIPRRRPNLPAETCVCGNTLVFVL